MSQSSPADLAVTFRSIARRVREAQGDAPVSVVAAPKAEIDEHVSAAASLLHCPPDAESVAEAILARPADEWEVAELDALRTNALEIGKLVRSIQALAGGSDRN